MTKFQTYFGLGIILFATLTMNHALAQTADEIFEPEVVTEEEEKELALSSQDKVITNLGGGAFLVQTGNHTLRVCTADASTRRFRCGANVRMP